MFLPCENHICWIKQRLWFRMADFVLDSKILNADFKGVKLVLLLSNDGVKAKK